MSQLQRLVDEIDVLKQFPTVAFALVVVVGLAVWGASRWFYTGTISNLKSQVALQQSQLEARPDSPLGPLPSYPLGGSDIMVYNSEGWTNQDTRRRVTLDWGSLGDVDADAVLHMRTEGEGWVQARIMNETDGEIVATTERHSGPVISARFRLPRAVGVKVYLMQVRGKNAGLIGNIEFSRSAPR